MDSYIFTGADPESDTGSFTIIIVAANTGAALDLFREELTRKNWLEGCVYTLTVKSVAKDGVIYSNLESRK